MKTLERFRGGSTQISSENDDMGGGSLQLSNIQRGDRLNFTLFSPKSPPSRR